MTEIKICFLVFFLCVVPQYLPAQVLVLAYNNGKYYRYNASSQQSMPISKAVHDSLSVLKDSTDHNSNVSDGDVCCRRFFAGDKVIILRYCGIAVLADEKILWSDMSIDCPAECNKDTLRYGCPHIELGVIGFSRNNEWILLVDSSGPMFSNRRAVIEYNLTTGVRKSYHKKTEAPEYSPDSKYILMRSSVKKDKHYLYDRNAAKKTEIFSDVKNIFWIKE